MIRLAAVVSGDIAVLGLEPPALERLRREFSFPNPKYVNRIRFGFHPAGEPERIEAMTEMPDGWTHFPRGAVAPLREQLARRDIALEFRDARTWGDPLGFFADPPPLRDYQAEAVAKLMRPSATQGLVILPCGTGKSRLGVGAIQAVDRTTLVLVPTEDLADQWGETLVNLYGIRPGYLGGGKKPEPFEDVVVAVVESADRLLATDPRWGHRFGFVILDEAHQAPALTFQRVLGQLPARYRLGLTATPDREDGLTAWVGWSFGPVLLERNTLEMIKLGYLRAASIEELETDFHFDGSDLPETKRMAALEAAISEDLVRNCQIADRVAADARAGETQLVLVGRREHAVDLANMIRSRGATAQAVTSQTARKKRQQAIEDLREGTLQVLVATQLADQGLDIPRLSRVHLAAPQRAQGRTAQRLGRLLRDFPGKQPRLIDYIDVHVPTLVRRAQTRRRVWRDAGLAVHQ